MDRLSKIVSRVTVGTILRIRGVPGGWVWLRAFLGTVGSTYDLARKPSSRRLEGPAGCSGGPSQLALVGRHQAKREQKRERPCGEVKIRCVEPLCHLSNYMK